MKYNNEKCFVKTSAARTNMLNMSEYPHIKDSDLFRVLRHLPKLSIHGPWVAGGAIWRTINNEPLEKCDIDIFFQSEKQFEQTVSKMNSLPMVNNIIKETKNKWNTIYKYHVHESKAYDKTVDVQFINMNFHPNLESLLDSFDFTVCQFGYDGENLHCGLSAMEDLAAKRIKLYSYNRPKSLFKHLYKYLDNGFTISNEQTKYLASQLMSMNCWKSSNAPDYDDDDLKKKKEDNNRYTSSPFYDSPFNAGERLEGFTTTAPIVEQEERNEEIVYDAVNAEPRPRRRTNQVARGERVLQERHRTAATVGEVVQTGWAPIENAAANTWTAYTTANTGTTQWPPMLGIPGHREENMNPPQNINPNPIDLMNQGIPAAPIVENIFDEVIHPVQQEIPEAPRWEEEGEVFNWERRLEEAERNPDDVPVLLAMARPVQVNENPNVEANDHRVVEQLCREGFGREPINVDRMMGRANQIVEEIRREQEANLIVGMNDVRQQVYNNARNALFQAFEGNLQEQGENNIVNREAEQEIANDAAHRAEIIERRNDGIEW